ncbi:MAG: hypothetical protein ACYC3X_24225 [Pirellulaceae bacterium]
MSAVQAAVSHIVRSLGDPVAFPWGPQTNLGLYGSSYAGLPGALVHLASDPQILQRGSLATNFFHSPALPTYLGDNAAVMRTRSHSEGGKPCSDW